MHSGVENIDLIKGQDSITTSNFGSTSISQESPIERGVFTAKCKVRNTLARQRYQQHNEVDSDTLKGVVEIFRNQIAKDKVIF